MTTFIWPQQSVSLAGAATEAKQDTIIGHVDGIEGEIISLNATDFATSAKQDSQITEAQSTNTKLDTVISHVDGVETKLDSLIAKTAGSLVPFDHDYIAYTSGVTTDTYVYKTGGVGGTTVATVTLTYTDSSKSVLSNVART